VKPIDHVLRLQQVVKLPGIHDSSSMTASLSNAAPQAKKPVRQQPPGLKMRFRPIGFGDGEPGRIGSSSSSVEEESPVVFRRPVRLPSQSSDDSSKSSESEGSSDVEMTNVSLKRKHGGEGRKPKHSSSRSSNIDDRELKRSKKKQTESQKRLEDRKLVSIEPHKSSKQRLPASTAITPTKEITPIRPQKNSIVPHSSPVPRVQVNARKDEQRSSGKPKCRKHDRSEPATRVRKSRSR
jgi:hypothetical protein